MMKRILYWGFLITVCLVLIQCGQTQSSNSQVFQSVIRPETGFFRGISLGDSLAFVLENEPQKPASNDLMGMVFEYELPTEAKWAIEYYTDNLASGSADNRVTAISCNIKLYSNKQTSQLYKEILDYFTHLWGPSKGSFGNDYWENPFQNIESHLKLMEAQNSITLNFVELK